MSSFALVELRRTSWALVSGVPTRYLCKPRPHAFFNSSSLIPPMFVGIKLIFFPIIPNYEVQHLTYEVMLRGNRRSGCLVHVQYQLMQKTLAQLAMQHNSISALHELFSLIATLFHTYILTPVLKKMCSSSVQVSTFSNNKNKKKIRRALSVIFIRYFDFREDT